MPDSQDIDQIKADAVRYVIPHFADYDSVTRDPKVFVRGEGCYLFDIEGNRYLDTFASLLTTICGHRNPDVDEAIRRQLDELEFFPNYVDTFTVPLVSLAKRLAEVLPGDLEISFFVNSGSEANETAMKMARQYQWEIGERNRHKILFRRWSYHATTLGAGAATGLPWFREYFEPLLSEACRPTYSARCYACELGLAPASCGLACLRMMEDQIKWEGPDSIAALIMDPLPGSNTGFPVPPDGYLQGVRDLCDKYGILLIFDEVQSGFGKTGRMFVCEHWGVTPDIMTLGKGFSGGYVPLGATVTNEKIYSVFRRPGHEFRSGSTYGGHTLACAATLANLEYILREGLVEKARALGEYLSERLAGLREGHACVGRISGIGLLKALFLEGNAYDGRGLGAFVRDYCWEHGMIMRANGNILVFAPALIITREQIDEMVALIDEALTAAEGTIRSHSRSDCSG